MINHVTTDLVEVSNNLSQENSKKQLNAEELTMFNVSSMRMVMDLRLEQIEKLSKSTLNRIPLGMKINSKKINSESARMTTQNNHVDEEAPVRTSLDRFMNGYEPFEFYRGDDIV